VRFIQDSFMAFSIESAIGGPQQGTLRNLSMVWTSQVLLAVVKE
jgi:hypothetical protein